MTRLSVCSLGVSCNEMIDTPILLVVGNTIDLKKVSNTDFERVEKVRKIQPYSLEHFLATDAIGLSKSQFSDIRIPRSFTSPDFGKML